MKRFSDCRDIGFAVGDTVRIYPVHISTMRRRVTYLCTGDGPKIHTIVGGGETACSQLFRVGGANKEYTNVKNTVYYFSDAKGPAIVLALRSLPDTTETCDYELPSMATDYFAKERNWVHALAAATVVTGVASVALVASIREDDKIATDHVEPLAQQHTLATQQPEPPEAQALEAQKQLEV
jgi:hypothetical protein